MKGKLAYDLGAYDGDTADDILKYYNNIVCIDANPHIIDKLNLKYKDNDNVKIMYGCISDSLEKEIKFYIGYNDQLSSIYKEISDYWYSNYHKEEILVPNINIKDIIDKHGLPEYIKIDIEGADIIALNQLNEIHKLPKYISCELQWFSKDSIGNENINVKILNKLRDLGYNRFYVYDAIRKNINNKEFNKEWVDCINFENNINCWRNYEDTYYYIKSINIDIQNWYDIFATKHNKYND